jgi:putative nucleotidyltransferase with HDIG domain
MINPHPKAGRVYVAGVFAAGVAVIAYSAWDLVQHPVGYMWLVLLALTSFSSTFSIRIPSVSATISVSETFVFITALLFGPSAATLTIALDGLVISTWRRHRRVEQMLFNVTQPPLSLFIATHVFFQVSGVPIGGSEPIDIGQNLVPLIIFTSTYFLINSGMNALVVSLHSGQAVWPIWRHHFGWVLLNYFGATSVAALLVHNSRSFNFTALAIVVPLMVISYLTFKTSMQRFEDTNRHLQELNKLYLSTIETLAMAVDAKDQITHGHIRRVQAAAVGLARTLGVKDDDQLKALEAAALLHDMGKLVIPEHILNKPGKLSAAEFETMKRHASIGADILSAIDFPYPVVPIVRHHHERWDGKGYPTGLSGADIPIGARILSVVDCFDALTSDRPYRRALSDDEAMQMLLEGRGTAYDPYVVDAFTRVHDEIFPKEVENEPGRRPFRDMGDVSHATARQRAAAADEITDRAETDPHMLPIYESLHSFSAQTVLADAAEEIARKLRAVTPATVMALFVYDPSSADLAVAHASGPGAAPLRGLRIKVGERLSGWVAANRQTICNSDPALDLAAPDEPFEGELRSCLSTPLVAGDGLVGVLSLYTRDVHGFDDSHRRLVEHTARPLAHLVRGALELEKVQHVTGPGALAQLPQASGADFDVAEEVCLCPVAAVSLQIHGLGEDEGSIGVPDLLLARAAAALRRDLRVADLLYRDGPNGLLAVLPHADGRAASTIAARAREGLISALQSFDNPAVAAARIVTGIGVAPADGVLLDDVMDAARQRALLARDEVPQTRPEPVVAPVARPVHLVGDVGVA